VVLYRLLSDIPADRYFLISRENYSDAKGAPSASEKLPGGYHRLTPPRRFRPTRIPGFAFAVESLNARIAVRSRARQIADIARREGCGLLIGCTGDLYDLPATALAARWAGLPFVPYIFDDYVYQWTGPDRRIAARLEPGAIRGAKAVIVPNEHTLAEYAKRYGVRGTIVRNPCPLPDLSGLDRAKRAFDPGSFHIVYAGAVYHANSDAFRRLISAIPRLEPARILLHIYTAQSPAELERYGIRGPMVIRHPHIPQGEIPAVLRQADILFLPLAFRSPIPEVIRTSAPGKTGEYLSVGRPILVHAPGDSFVSWYFRENRCGIVVDEEDPGALAGAIARILEDETLRSEVSMHARRAAERDYGIEHAREAFLGLMESVVGAQ